MRKERPKIKSQFPYLRVKNEPEKDFLTYFRIVDSFFIFSPQEELL